MLLLAGMLVFATPVLAARRASLTASKNGVVAAHVAQGKWPLILRLGMDRSYSSMATLTAASGESVASGDGNAVYFLARKSRASYSNNQSLLLCAATVDKTSCQPSPFSEDSPLLQGLLRNQLLGWNQTKKGKALTLLDLDDHRVLHRGRPMEIISLAAAVGRMAVLTHVRNNETVIRVYDGKNDDPAALPCNDCVAVLSPDRFSEWVMLLAQPKAQMDPAGNSDMPVLPGNPLGRIEARALSLVDGAMGPPVVFSFPLLPPGPPDQGNGISPYDGFTLTAIDKEFLAWRLCRQGVGCQDFLRQGLTLKKVGNGLFEGKAVSPLSGGQWLDMPLPPGANAVLEWTDNAGEILSSAPLGPDNPLEKGDGFWCALHGCSPWNFEETIWNIFPADGKDILGSKPSQSALVPAGLDAMLWQRGAPKTRILKLDVASTPWSPLWLGNYLFAGLPTQGFVIHPPTGKLLKQISFPKGFLPVQSAVWPGETGVLFPAQGGVFYAFKAGIWKLKPWKTGAEPYAWISGPTWALGWGKKSHVWVSVSGKGKISVKRGAGGGALGTFSKHAKGLAAQLGGRLHVFGPGANQHVLSLANGAKLKGLYQSTHVLFVLFKKDERFFARFFARDTLFPGKTISLPWLSDALMASSGPGVAEFPGRSCLLFPAAQKCVTPDGRVLDTGFPPQDGLLNAQASRLGAGSFSSMSLQALNEPNMWRRQLQGADKSWWIWEAMGALVQGTPVGEQPWVKF